MINNFRESIEMSRSILSYIFIISLFFVTLTGCNNNSTGPGFGEPDYSTVPDMPDTTNATKVTVGDLSYYVIKEGGGNAQVQNRDEISAYYTMRREDGTILTSTYINGLTRPQDVSVSNFSTEGFEIGVAGMKVNERRVIVVPPSLAFGDADESSPNYDLRNDTIYYVVEIDWIYSFESM